MRLFPILRHDSTKYIRLNTSLCKACWMCVQACPNDVIGKVDLPIHKHAHIDQAEKCKGCQKCVRACPNGAILYTGYEQPRKSGRSMLERALKKVLPPTLLLVCLVLMVVSHRVFPVQTIFPIPFNLVGLVPLALGVFTSVSANRQFAKVGTNVNTFNEPGTLVADGWFSHSRNPMYLGCVLTLAGTWILLGSMSPILGVLAFTAITDRWYIAYEEQKMAAIFGQVYQDYKQQVRRWI